MICGFDYSHFYKEEGSNVGEFITNGIAYAVKIPDNVTPLEKGYVYIHHHITEQGQTLYGFLDREDRDLFKDLISVDGVGPAMALKIMSFYPSEKIRIDIADGDVEDFCKAKGVGKKSAEKIISELKEKYKKYATNTTKEKVSKEDFGADMSGLVAAMALAEKALIKLSFPVKEAKERVNAAMKKINAEQMKEWKFGERPCEEIVPDLIRLALTN